ncbi:unnamed protein product [Rangifer tarandus platyrhynchus]|uniref:Uncharacterized protein n=1 Tax=Rangifer tarandus platyrhynchus TaxID=3082113 RepID=A0AC59YS85_RANTA
MYPKISHVSCTPNVHSESTQSASPVYGVWRSCVLSCLSCVQICAALWTVAFQALLSMGFSRQEYRNGLLCPPAGDFPHPGIKPASFVCPTLAGKFFTTRNLEEYLKNLPYSLNSQGFYHCEFFLNEVVQFSSVQLLSHIRLFVTPWTAACQASLSITNSKFTQTDVH